MTTPVAQVAQYHGRFKAIEFNNPMCLRTLLEAVAELPAVRHTRFHPRMSETHTFRSVRLELLSAAVCKLVCSQFSPAPIDRSLVGSFSMM